jgi:hypothetical protein
MTRALVVVVAVLLLGSAWTAGAQPLTDDQIAAIIRDPGKAEPGLHLDEAFNLAASGFVIDVYSPAAWLRLQAQKAKREMRPFTPADVDAEMRADVWRVKAFPSMPRRLHDTIAVSSVSHVVIRDKSAATVIQPLTKSPFPHSAQNALGASVSYDGLDAGFPGEAVRGLWGERSDRPFWISVIGPDWKYDFEIKPKHFDKLK